MYRHLYYACHKKEQKDNNGIQHFMRDLYNDVPHPDYTGLLFVVCCFLHFEWRKKNQTKCVQKNKCLKHQTCHKNTIGMSQ